METKRMQNGEIEVSVIMPAYNAEKHIARAIESVLEQKASLELIVIDDCSTDKTAAIVEAYSRKKDSPVKLVLNQSRQGPAEARNEGIRQARGKYIAFLDADDWWSREKLQVQLPFLKAHGGILCYTGRELMHSDGSTTGKIVQVPEKVTYEMLLRTNSIPCSSVLLKTKVAREFYMTHDELHEDYILWLKILKKYKEAYGMNEPMLKSRLSENGKSRNKWKSARMQYGVYRLLGISRWRALGYFVQYAWNGIRKYYY